MRTTDALRSTVADDIPYTGNIENEAYAPIPHDSTTGNTDSSSTLNTDTRLSAKSTSG